MVIISCTVIICVAGVAIFIARFYFNFAGNKRITDLERRNNDLRSDIRDVRRTAFYVKGCGDSAKLIKAIDEIINITE